MPLVKGRLRFGAGHPPAESGFKTKDLHDGTIGTFYFYQKKQSALEADCFFTCKTFLFTLILVQNLFHAGDDFHAASVFAQ